MEASPPGEVISGSRCAFSIVIPPLIGVQLPLAEPGESPPSKPPGDDFPGSIPALNCLIFSIKVELDLRIDKASNFIMASVGTVGLSLSNPPCI